MPVHRNRLSASARFGAAACLLVSIGMLSACASDSDAGSASRALPGTMASWERVSIQRPALPQAEYIAWTPADRLYGAVSLDFVEGLPKRSYLFSRPSRKAFKALLADRPRESGLYADPDSPGARYALQVRFDDVNSSIVGANFLGRSNATYRIVNRRSGEIVYNGMSEASFLAIYPKLNEEDASDAWNVSIAALGASASAATAYVVGEGGVVELVNSNNDIADFFGGPIDEATQATWDEAGQSFVWASGVSALLGPLEIMRRTLNPLNYFALGSADELDAHPYHEVRNGVLAEQGWGSRDGGKRARMANARMLDQSIARFIIDLAAEENVAFKAILPCSTSLEVEKLKRDLMQAGVGFETETCSPSRLGGRPTGLRLNRWD